MGTLRPGTRVHVEYDGIIANNYYTDKFVVVDEGGGQHWYESDLNIVTRADPENWPPRPGDIWEAEDCEYFAYEDRFSGNYVIIFPFDKDTVDPDGYSGGYSDQSYSSKHLADFKALAPTLTRRR